MPKPRADKVVVHRLDLQPSLKESLDTFLIGRTVTNGMQGIGAMLAPFGPALSVLVGAWIAKEGVEGAIDAATTWATRKGEDIAEERYGDELAKYKLVCSTLMGCSNVQDLEAVDANLRTQLGAGPPPNLVRAAYKRFKSKGISDGWLMDPSTQWGESMKRRWMAFYPVNALIEEMKADAKEYPKKKAREWAARILFPISNLWL